MMLPSHLLATVLAGLLLSRVRPWTARTWGLALAFGVAIDADHLLQIPRYAAEHGGAAALLDVPSTLAWGPAWQGFMHDPIAGAAVALAASAAARSLAPAAFWGLHMVQDFVVARHLVHFGGPVEWAIVAGLAAAVGAVAWDAHRRSRDARPFGRWAAAVVAGALVGARR